MQNRQQANNQDITWRESNWIAGVIAAKIGFYAGALCLCPARTAAVACTWAVGITTITRDHQSGSRPLTESIINAASAASMMAYGYSSAMHSSHQLYTHGERNHHYTRKLALIGYIPSLVTTGLSIFTFNRVKHLENPANTHRAISPSK